MAGMDRIKEEHEPTEKEITDLSMAEGHDADIPSNIGSLPPQHIAPRQQQAKSTASSIHEKEKDFDIDVVGSPSSDGIPSSRTSSIILDEEARLPLSKTASRIDGANVAVEEEDDEYDNPPDIVFWDGPEDPANPKNWTESRKWAVLTLISLITFLTPLGSAAFAPGVPQLMREFGSDSTLLSGFVVSVYVLGFAIGPLIIAPLSEMYGRAPLYHATGILFTIFTIACALARTLDELIVFRFFAGCFGAAPLALGGGTIADVAHADKRAIAMAIWTMGPTIGPVVGPVAGGFVCNHIGWRWMFWIIAIASGLINIFSFIAMKETYAPALLAQKTIRLRKETGNPHLRSKLDNGMTTKQLFLYSIVRPSKMLIFSPVVLSQSLYVAIIYSYLYIMFTTVTEVFEKQYGFRSDLVGLAYVGMGLGSLIGQLGYTWADNVNYKFHERKGDLKPEHRLYAMVPGSIIMPISLFWYGWSVQAQVHWICPIIAMAFLGLALLLIFMSAANYLVDVFTVHAASAMAANTVLRSLFAAIIPLAGPSLYHTLGYGWGASLLGFVSMACIPVPFLFLRYGEWLRTTPRFQVNL